MSQQLDGKGSLNDPGLACHQVTIFHKAFDGIVDTEAGLVCRAKLT